MNDWRPFIVGIGGTTAPDSSTELALRTALAAAGRAGARVRLFGGGDLAQLPHYMGSGSVVSNMGADLVAAVRRANGLIIASPGYHGSISGLVKNALDYFEQMARDERVYIDGLPVGLIATAYGWQATGSTLATLRSIVHALRGWPTPLGAAINSSAGIFKRGRCTDDKAEAQLNQVGSQVVEFSRLRNCSLQAMV